MNDSLVEIPWCVDTVVGTTWIVGQGVSELPVRSRTSRTTLLTFSYNPITINFTTDRSGPCTNLHSGEKHTQQRIGRPTVLTEEYLSSEIWNKSVFDWFTYNWLLTRPTAIVASWGATANFKGLVELKCIIHPFTTLYYDDGGSGDIFTNPCNHFGFSLRESIPPNASTMDAYGSHVLCILFIWSHPSVIWHSNLSQNVNVSSMSLAKISSAASWIGVTFMLLSWWWLVQPCLKK